MEKGDPRFRDAKEKLLHLVNAEKPSPEQRALFLWNLVREHYPDVTDWDVICFCVEALGVFVSAHPWLERPVRDLSGLVYKAHYLGLVDTEARSRSEGESAGDSDRVTDERIVPDGSSTSPANTVHIRDNQGVTGDEEQANAVGDVGSSPSGDDGKRDVKHGDGDNEGG